MKTLRNFRAILSSLGVGFGVVVVLAIPVVILTDTLHRRRSKKEEKRSR